MSILYIGSDGATLKEKRPDPFANNEQKEVTISEYGLEDFPLNSSMELKSIDIENNKVRLDIELEPERFDNDTKLKGEFWKAVENELDIEKKGEEILLSQDRNATANYRLFLDFLRDNGYLIEEQLPLQLQNARNRYLINTNKLHMGGQSMSDPYRVDDNIFAETNFDSGDIKRNIRVLGERLKG
jgi:hypothetical protein